MSHKQAKRLRHEQRALTGSCPLDLKRQRNRDAYEERRIRADEVERLRREQPEKYARLYARQHERRQAQIRNIVAVLGAVAGIQRR